MTVPGGGAGAAGLSVLPAAGEAGDVSADPTDLARAADRTGGTVARLRDVAADPAGFLPPPPTPGRTGRVRRPLPVPLTVMLLAGLLGAEWTLRRQAGEA